MENIQSDYITVINSMLLLVDYQKNLISNIRSGDRQEICDAVIASARAAAILNVPVILSATDNEEYGEFLKELPEIFPRQEVIKRRTDCISALDDDRIHRIIKRKGREKIIISGLWTSRSFTETAIQAANEGYDVYGMIDCCGDISHERHNYGVQKMLKAGVTPITWMSLASEWMNGWVDPTEGELSDDIFGKYNAMLSYLSKH